MEELDKGVEISMTGPKAEEALAAFHKQIHVWGLAMPPVQPLVLDFGLGQFDRVGLIEYWIANEAAAGYCGKYLFVFDGQQCPAHRHKTKHETFFPIQGRLEVILDGRTILLQPGDVLPVPPGHLHSFQGIGNSLLLELSMPCEVSDNAFENPAIMAWLKRFV